MTRFVDHSKATGTLAETLAEEVQAKDADAAFISGLIHDVGKVILVSVDREAVDQASGITSKPANEDHFKTGQWN